MTETISESKKRFWLTLLRPKVAIPLGLFVLVLLSPVLYRGWNLGHIPDLGDPFPEEMLEKPGELDENNAWVNYRKAEELLVSHQNEAGNPPAFRKHHLLPPAIVIHCISIWREPRNHQILPDLIPLPPTSIELSDYLRWHQEALEEWKIGTTKDQYFEVSPLIEHSGSIGLLEVLSDDHGGLQFNEMALSRVGLLASQGEYSEALEWMLAVFRYSRHLTQSGGTDNWERAIEVSQGVFAALDELLDDDVYTHEDLIAFLRELEQAHNLTGNFDQALVDDYLTLRQQILNAYELNTKYHEEIEAGSSVIRKNRFEMYVEGEPQLSLRLLQHHFEYLKRNLKKPVADRVMSISWSSWSALDKNDQLKKLYRDNSVSNETSLSSDDMETGIQSAILLREIIDQNHFFSNTFLREEDNMLFESLRILIAAHAFLRLYPQSTNWTDESFITLNDSEEVHISPLPFAALEELVADSLTDTPHDPYNSTSNLIMAVCRDGEVFVVSSLSEEYERLARGDPPESLQERFFSLNSVPFPPTIPVIDTWKFQLPTAASRESLPVNNRHAKGLQWVPEDVPEEEVEYLRVLH